MLDDFTREFPEVKAQEINANKVPKGRAYKEPPPLPPKRKTIDNLEIVGESKIDKVNNKTIVKGLDKITNPKERADYIEFVRHYLDNEYELALQERFETLP